MGCDCIKPEEITKEIKTYNTEIKDNYIILKNDKIRDIDTYINSIKTSDKITYNTNKNNEISTSSKKKINGNKGNNIGVNNIIISSEKINEKVNTSKNNTNEETAKKTLDNINKNKIITKNPKTINKNNIKKTNKILLDKNSKKNIIKKQIKKKREILILPKDDFSKYIFEHINNIRLDPQSFIPNIEEAKSFIVRNKKNKLIYKNKVKVALSQGLLAFEEAISILKFAKPMNKLIFDPNLVVKLPENEEDIINKNYFKDEIKKMIKKGISIQAYWRDIIKEPETSFLMMIVDDTGLKAGLKRKDILDPNMKYIGISSTKIGKHFVCFMTFSNCKL